MKIDIQRLRNLTTGRLHTKMDHIYEDLGLITGESGLMTHMLPRAMRACEPWLREHISDQRFWNDQYDITHTGEFTIPEPTAEDRKVMFQRYCDQPNPPPNLRATLRPYQRQGFAWLKSMTHMGLYDEAAEALDAVLKIHTDRHPDRDRMAVQNGAMRGLILSFAAMPSLFPNFIDNLKRVSQ